MTFRSYLLNLIAGTVFALIMLVSFVFSTDPDIFSMGVEFSFVIFYILFFFTITGFSILLLTWMWNKMSEEQMTAGELGMSVRQGVLLGALMTILMFFQQMKILTWWDALLVAGGILLIELYFLTR